MGMDGCLTLLNKKAYQVLKLPPGVLTIIIPAHAHGVAERYTTGLARLKLVTRANSDQTEFQLQDKLYLLLSRQGRFEPL
jgi:hypothetical protein